MWNRIVSGWLISCASFAGLAALSVTGCGGARDFADESEATESQAQAITAGTVLAYEAENLARTASSVGSKVTAEGPASGGKYVEFNGTAATGAWVELTLPAVAAGAYSVQLLYKSNNNRGIAQASVDGVNLGTSCSEYAASAAYQVACGLGTTATLAAGNHQLRFTVIGKAASSMGFQLTIDQIKLTAKAADGPCDLYASANTPCVAAYSMVRALSKNYSGPLYQVRNGSSATNTGSGGVTKDIGLTADGFADTASQDSFCANSICTVSTLYDQSGNQNDLKVAKKGNSAGGAFAGQDDFESSATLGVITAGGHKVYSLYSHIREGYRTPVGVVGKNMPVGSAAQGIYQLADGTHSGTACCWEFGNVTTDPTKYNFVSTLFLGKAYWGIGAGSGPWFMADFEGGIWAGGSKVGDPGWGGLSDSHPPNPNDPSLKVPFALGFLKIGAGKYAIRAADTQTASNVTTAYEGAMPLAVNNSGGIVLGVGSDNSNNSWGTFYEGAILSGYPSDAADLSVLKNIQTVGYTK